MRSNEYLAIMLLGPFFKGDPIVGVEIGTKDGYGTMEIFRYVPNLKLYTIDPYLHIKGRGFEMEREQEWHDANYELAKERTKNFNCTIMKMGSDEAALIINEPLDFVYIDGDHNEDQFRRDMQWRHKLKPRSILAGHDAQMPHIRRVVQEEIGEFEDGIDFVWYRKYE